MKLKKALKYQLTEAVRPVAVFYAVILAIHACFLLAFSIRRDAASVGGMEAATVIFLFVAGLNSFKSTFGMFMQNGLSRRTLFTSFAAGALIIAAAMTAADFLLGLAAGAVMEYWPLYDSIYYYPDAGPAFRAAGLLWAFALNAAALMAGYFITTLYYRMNRWQKITVSVGGPVFLFVVLPVLLRRLYKGMNPFSSQRSCASWILYWCERIIGSPYLTAALFAAAAVILAGLSWLLVRRAVVRA